MKTLFRFSLSASLLFVLAAKHVEERQVSNVEGDGGRDRNNALDVLWIRRKTRDLREKKNYKKRKLNNKDGKAKREKNRKGKLKEHNTKRKKKDRKKKSSKKRKGKNKTKYQKKKKKNGKNRGKKKERKKTKKKSMEKKLQRNTTTCSTDTVAENCLENAQIALNYEKNQVTNYLKQSARLKGHKNIKEKKLFKNGEFNHAADHLIFAVGGNMSDPKCGDPNDNSTEALETKAREFEYILSNYTLLRNCSNAITEACTLSNETFNDSHEAELDACNQTKWQFIMDSRRCHKLQQAGTNATEICECWGKAAADVEEIKAKKCETKKKQKAITAQKNFCKKVFKQCKDMEDHSIHLTWHCMHDHSMHLINQTAKNIHEGIIKDAKTFNGLEKLMNFEDLDFESTVLK